MKIGIQPGWLISRTLQALVLSASGVAGAATFVPDEVTATGPDAGKIVDPEFDAQQGQFCWISEGYPNENGDESLWVGRLDPQTGLFDPPSGQFARADFGSIVGVKNIGNGCEWASAENGAQIVYTKLEGGTTLKDRQVARAVYTQYNWTADILDDVVATYAPIGSTDPDDPNPKVAYQGFVAPDTPRDKTRAIYVRPLDDASSEQMIPTTDELFTPGARWIPGSNSVIFTRPMESGGRQVFIYDMDTQILEQLTDNDTEKYSASMWSAPEYDGEQLFLALEDEEYLGIYRLLDPDGDGIKTWTQSHIVDPPAQGTYIWSPEPFVVNGRSYIVMTTSTSSDQASLVIPTEIWVAGIDPDNPFFRKLSDERQLVRKDPEAVVLAGDLPLVRSGSPADFMLTESGNSSSTGQLIAVGSADTFPAGGRNAILVFELPPLPPGMIINDADFGVQVLASASQGAMAADLWALSISTNLDPSLVFLEQDEDPGTNQSLAKIADDFLTGATSAGTRVALGEPQKLALVDYLMDFYDGNPGYNGGHKLYLRLNPDMDGGTETEGWSVAASDHVAEVGPALTLDYSRRQDIGAAIQDFTLTEDLRELAGAGNLRVGSAARSPSGPGRNAIFAFDLPPLPSGNTVQSATLSFVVGSNTATAGVNADLWALTIQPTGDDLPRNYLESDSDPDNLHVKIADNILTETTTVNEKVSLGASEADTLGDYLRSFYAQPPASLGDKTLYLRLNPDADTGFGNAGWRVYSRESPRYVRPLLRVTISSPEKVWVYTSSGGEMHRMATGL